VSGDHLFQPAPHDIEIPLRGLEAAVAHQLLHFDDGRAGVERLGPEGVAQGVDAGRGWTPITDDRLGAVLGAVVVATYAG
jgi:hypothetical protein